MKLSLLVPVYGSEKILEKSYEHLKKAAQLITKDYEILFRYDCSPDNSYEVLKRIAKKDKKVRIFRNEKNNGLGFTLRNLFKDAKGEFVIYLDADAYMCFHLEDIKRLMKEINKYDVVIASRYKESTKNVPLYRIYPSVIYFWVYRILFGLNIRDIGSGFVIFRKNALDSIKLISDGFDIHLEIYCKLRRAGFKIKELPVYYKHWYGGSFDILKHGPKTLLNTFRIWIEMFK